MKLFASIFFFLSFYLTSAQTHTATVVGTIIDENGQSLSNVSISILGQHKNIRSEDDGSFRIKVPAEKHFALTFTHTSYYENQKNFYLSNRQSDSVIIVMRRSAQSLDTVVISDNKERKENGLIKINPKNALYIPSTTGGIESLIKTLVGSNNELSSQYSVRGGNFDENSIYINDFEVYRPYLVSNGQQEGLSFINPELVKNINFYTGGFQAKYGDKMSSVLDIQYKQPSSFEGSAYLSGMEQGFHYSGTIKKNKASMMIGVRNKNNNSLLRNQPTQGAYIPSASDFQSLIHYNVHPKFQLELLGIRSVSSFSYYPESVKKTAAVFSPIYTANIGMDTYFEGQEKDKYQTQLLGATLIFSPSSKLKLKWLASIFQDAENENFDITGSYIFGERDVNNESNSFEEIVNPLGAGSYQQYARNHLKINIFNLSHRGSYQYNNHVLQWGNTMEKVNISDNIKGFEYQDSAGYSLPYNPSSLQLYNSSYSATNLNIEKFNGFIQENFRISRSTHDINIQAGIRYYFNNLNRELLISPRIQTSWKPNCKKDIVFKFSSGIYNQPPFYRELKNYNGNLSTSLKSQKSIQFVAGMDYQFIGFNETPFRLSTEAFYKKITDVIPYDIDNVKIKYWGENNAKAYATGLEVRLFGELIKDAESWFSLGIMKTQENLHNDYYYQHLNSDGQIINANSSNTIIKDSVKQNIGYIRRPTDRLITAGLFLQDYLSTNKNFKVHFNFLYGSNMPYNIPNSTKYRNALTINSYIRADVGFSALLLSDENIRRIHSPFYKIKNIWASLEIFNFIDKANTISYQLIKDFSNNIYALPNTLTPRMLNFKFIVQY